MYLLDLMHNGEIYNPDDDVFGIVWHPDIPPKKKELKRLQRNMKKCWQWFYAHGEDIHGFILGNDPDAPKGIDSDYLEAYHEIAQEVERWYANDEMPEPHASEGYGGRWSLAKAMTDGFIKENETIEDGEFLDVIERYCRNVHRNGLG